MSADIKPSTWLGSGYTVNTGSHIVSMTTNDAGSNIVLKNLTDAEADPTTGDIRKVAFEFVEAMFQAWTTQVAASNQPLQMTISRSSFENAAGELTRTYNLQFNVSGGTVDVVPE